MIELLNPLLAGGLLAAGVPVAIHLLSRRKTRRIDWGAMRFLRELVAKRRKRLLIEQWLLLLARTLLLACIALALTRPVWRTVSAGDTGAGGRIRRTGRVAAVLLLDDSFSTATARETLDELALRYIDTLKAGDEVSVVRTSAAEATGPLYDLDEVRERLEQVRPTDVGDDPAALLTRGLAQLEQHLNPAAELVLVTDGAAAGWDRADAAAWEGLRTRLTAKGAPRLLVLRPSGPPPPAAAAVTDLTLDNPVVTAGEPVTLRATVRRAGAQDSLLPLGEGERRPDEGASQPSGIGKNPLPKGEGTGQGRIVLPPGEGGRKPDEGSSQPSGTGKNPHPNPLPTGERTRRGTSFPKGERTGQGNSLPKGERTGQGDVRLLVGGSEVASRALPEGGAGELTFTYVFERTGAHAVEAVLPGGGRRALVVVVQDALPVLLVEDTAGGGLAGTLGFAAAALQPQSEDVAGRFAVHRIAATALTAERLAEHRVAILGDLRALPASAAGALERFVVTGGGLLVSVGPGTDAELVDRFWWKDGLGFLAAPLAEAVVADEPLTVEVPTGPHPALAAFSSDTAAAWQAADVSQLLAVGDAGAAQPTTVLRTESGLPLLLERPVGAGRSALWLTTLDPQWTRLPLRPAFVPLLRELVTHLAGPAGTGHNLVAGERLTLPVPEGDNRILLSGPDGVALPLERTRREQRPVLLSGPLTQAGVHRVGDEPYAVTRPAYEESTGRLAAGAVADRLGVPDLPEMTDPAEIDRRLGTPRSRSGEFWQWLVVAAVALLFAESVLTRLRQRDVQTAEAAEVPA